MTARRLINSNALLFDRCCPRAIACSNQAVGLKQGDALLFRARSDKIAVASEADSGDKKCDKNS
jgi:hypothetical protein